MYYIHHGAPLPTRYVIIWKKKDGSWFLYTDIFNSNVAS